MGKTIRSYKKEDFSQISEWFLKRNLPVIDSSFLPDTGFIVDEVAAGFIYLMNAPIGLIDCFISNPESEKEKRDEALNDIVFHLLCLAKGNGVKMVKCDTQQVAVKDRAIYWKFKRNGKFLSFVKEI